MPQPYNYSMTPADPMPGMMQALQVGSAIGQIRDTRAQASAQAQRQAQIQAAFDAVHENPTAENYVKLANMLPPEQGKSVRESFTMLDQNAQQATLNDSARVFSAFKAGRPEIAIDMLSEKVAAYRNAGDEKGAKQTQTLLDLAESGPDGIKAVEDFFGFTIAQMPGGKDAIESVIKFAEEKRAAAAEPTARLKALADLGLTEEQTKKVMAETRKLSAETAKIIGEMEAAAAAGGLDPEKRFSSELQLNKEYDSRIKGFTEATRLDHVIKTAAADGTGAGDLSLVFSFMKMLDPNSVVRESEFAAAQDTSGLLDKLKVQGERIQSGQLLTPNQRKDFARLANQYMEASRVHEKKVRDGLDLMVKNYGLNPENVFGTAALPEPGTPAAEARSELQDLKAFLKTRWPAESARIDSLDMAGLQKEYPKTIAQYQPAGQAAATEPVRTGVW